MGHNGLGSAGRWSYQGWAGGPLLGADFRSQAARLPWGPARAPVLSDPADGLREPFKGPGSPTRSPTAGRPHVQPRANGPSGAGLVRIQGHQKTSPNRLQNRRLQVRFLSRLPDFSRVVGPSVNCHQAEIALPVALPSFTPPFASARNEVGQVVAYATQGRRRDMRVHVAGCPYVRMPQAFHYFPKVGARLEGQGSVGVP